MKDKLSIIVYSCWKNRDMWEIFSKLFRKFWHDCQLQIILVTDTFQETGRPYIFTKIVQIDDTWAKMIKAAIKEAQTPYVSLWMDDYLLCDYVQNKDIDNQLRRAMKYNAANLRLIESPPCQGHWQRHKNIGCYRRGRAYSFATQIGIWNSNFLVKTISDEWSAWDFERIASLRKSTDCPEDRQPILVALDYEFPYEEGVRKGKWMQQGAKLCRRNGIKLDTKVRPIMTNLEMAKIYFQGAVIDWNGTLVLQIQNLMGKIKDGR